MNRSTIYLLIILLVLGSIVYFLLPSENEKERTASYKTESINIGVDSASVVKIEIERTGKSVTIENVGGKWTITSPVNYTADESAVKQIISGLKKFQVGSLISSNPDKQSLFQVDTSGTKLTVTDRNGKVTSLVVGKMGPSYTEVYFRLPGSKDVYLGEGLDTWSITKEVKDWRDKTILATSSETIKDLAYSVGNRQFEFHHDSTSWKSGGKSVDVTLINPTLNSLATLRADDFVDAPTSMRAHPATVTIHASDETVLNFYPMLPDSSKYYVQKSGLNQTFIVSKWTVQQIFKPIEQHVAAVKSTPSIAEVTKESVAPPPPPKEEVVKNTEPPVESKPKDSKSALIDRIMKSKKEVGKTKEKPKEKPAPPKEIDTTVAQEPITSPSTKIEPQIKPETSTQPAAPPKQSTVQPASTPDDEGDLTVHTVRKGETMQTIAKKYNVTVEQILKWNLLKSIAVRPGQELYVYIRK